MRNMSQQVLSALRALLFSMIVYIRTSVSNSLFMKKWTLLTDPSDKFATISVPAVSIHLPKLSRIFCLLCFFPVRKSIFKRNLLSKSFKLTVLRINQVYEKKVTVHFNSRNRKLPLRQEYSNVQFTREILWKCFSERRCRIVIMHTQACLWWGSFPVKMLPLKRYTPFTIPLLRANNLLRRDAVFAQININALNVSRTYHTTNRRDSFFVTLQVWCTFYIHTVARDVSKSFK